MYPGNIEPFNDFISGLKTRVMDYGIQEWEQNNDLLCSEIWIYGWIVVILQLVSLPNVCFKLDLFARK